MNYFEWPYRNAKNATQKIDRINNELRLRYVDRTELEGTGNVGLPMSRIKRNHGEEADQKQHPRVFAEAYGSATTNCDKHLNKQISVESSFYNNALSVIDYKPVLTASHPWSNNSPSGVFDLVRRACLPSIASSDW